jgi:hypothetical protein
MGNFETLRQELSIQVSHQMETITNNKAMKLQGKLEDK